MKCSPTMIYERAQYSVRQLTKIRKVKLFPRVRTVTLVAYYKDQAQADYVGQALIIDWFKGVIYQTTIMHNCQAPPNQEESQEEETEDRPPMPAIGFQEVIA